MPSTNGFSHIALSVTDLDRSLAWYGRVLGARPLMTFEHDGFRRTVMGLEGGALLGLTQHDATGDDDAFSPSRVGLDHVGLAVDDVASLEEWVAHLDGLGVDHGGIQRDPELGSALVAAHDPDGIQVEWYLQEHQPVT